MTIDERYQRARDVLERHGQAHLLRFWDELDEARRVALLDQIEELDWEQLDRWIETHVRGPGTTVIPPNPQPAPYYPAQPGSEQQAEYHHAVERGQQLLRAGRVGAFVVAGGQGTRLGFDGPKGNFPISPIRRKTLFAIFAEGLLAGARRYGHAVCWYVMTSPLNHEPTVAIFEQNDYFGLGKDNVFLFPQGTLPSFDRRGRILLADKHQLCTNPDGHGGSLRALHRSGALEHMRQRGIEVLSYWQVDNPLVRVLDPLFIGLHADAGAGMSSKALKKRDPLEKVGNFCLADGRVTVIEYSDLTDEQAHRRNEDGSLVFELGSIGIHVLSRAFVERLGRGELELPIHRAEKKVAHLDEQGRRIEPDTPNGIKLEMFIFDALPLSQPSIILETIRREEFAPVKNATGVDSPEVTERMMIERAAAWLEAAGVDVPRREDGTPDCVIEIAPSFALDAQDVRAKRDRIPPIERGAQVYLE